VIEFSGRSVEDLCIAHQVDVDRRTGAASLAVPIPVPVGRGGLGPPCSLVYTAGAGNSPFGMGWRLGGLPTVGIDVHDHVPRWDGSDGFQLGGDEIVPWLVRSGNDWRPRGFVTPDWSVAFYRSRSNGAQHRIEKWVHRMTGRIHFRTRDARNVITVFGARADGTSRIADPGDAMRTYQWLPDLVVDPTGNAMWLDYLADAGDGVDRTVPYERRRPPPAQRYLKRIRYGNVAPVALDDGVVAGAMPATHFCFHVVFDYGDHAGEPPAAVPDRAWPVRADAFSTSRPGFEVRTYRLCRRVLVFHDFAEIGPDPALMARSCSATTRIRPAPRCARSDTPVTAARRTGSSRARYRRCA
jgi:hypothetical protein